MKKRHKYVFNQYIGLSFRRILVIVFSTIVLSCNTDSFELNKISEYEFRRSYHGIENIADNDMEDFTNTPPVQMQEYDDAFYEQLVKTKMVVNKKLQLNTLDSITNNTFDYHRSSSEILKVKINYLDEDIETNTAPYELVFLKNNDIVKRDTLNFTPMTNVYFYLSDIDENGKNEIITVSEYYIVNGHNYHINFYQLN